MSKKLKIPSLMLVNFVSVIRPLITSILVIEIALSFDVEVGIVGQLGTARALLQSHYKDQFYT